MPLEASTCLPPRIGLSYCGSRRVDIPVVYPKPLAFSLPLPRANSMVKAGPVSCLKSARVAYAFGYGQTDEAVGPLVGGGTKAGVGLAKGERL